MLILVEKRLQSKVLKFVLIVCLLSGSPFIYAQKQSNNQNPIASDTNAIKKQKQGFFSFFTHLFNKKPSTDYVKKKKSKPDTSATKKTEPFDLTKGSMTWTSLYTQGINLNTGINGLYSIGRLSQGFDIYGVPLTGIGTGVFDNGQFERSYSSYSGYYTQLDPSVSL